MAMDLNIAYTEEDGGNGGIWVIFLAMKCQFTKCLAFRLASTMAHLHLEEVGICQFFACTASTPSRQLSPMELGLSFPHPWYMQRGELCPVGEELVCSTLYFATALSCTGWVPPLQHSHPSSRPAPFLTCSVIFVLSTLTYGQFNNVVKITRPLPFGYGDLGLKLQSLL